ncbi:MAG: 1-aminocyclopropane-1-carboxylate deaminase/D-cysteine desulfhydrase, partial [Gemmatimonadaceae bacterium]
MIPLVARFPALERIPRVSLGSFPSPVERYVITSGSELWIKRDDLNAPAFGGNKVRSLEYLLARVRPGDAVLTIGGVGSTHVLTTAAHARA